MDSDLAWVDGKSGRQSWRYAIADAFQRSIISKAIYYFTIWLSESVSPHTKYNVTDNRIDNCNGAN